MKVFSLFSGIGAFERALETLNIKYDLMAYSEIDKNASKAYALIHKVSESLNLGDITKIDETKLPKDIDLITYGFPCQDISIAGKQKGFATTDGKTRSGLFFDALRIIQTTKPRIAIAENVKNLTSKRFKNEFEIVLKSLEDAGYNNYWQVLNAKDFGIPQNRERVFIISIRKDIDNYTFKFPEKMPLKFKLKDFLENQIEDSFYIKNYSSFSLINEYCGMLSGGAFEKLFDISKRAYSIEYIAPTIHTRQDGNTGTKIFIYENGLLKIRKLTPTECFRLMGFSGKYVEILRENKISTSQIYKMAGNSIVVNVLVEIFKKLERM